MTLNVCCVHLSELLACLYICTYVYSPSESGSDEDEGTAEVELDPGVEVPPDIAEASKPSWLYRSSKSPPNRGKSPPNRGKSPSTSRKGQPSKREAEPSGNRKRSPPVQPRVRVSKDCCSSLLCVLCGRHEENLCCPLLGLCRDV